MRGALVTVLMALALSAPASFAQTSAPGPSPLLAARMEAHTLRVENAQLRAAMARLQAERDSAVLTVERQQIEADLRAELQPPAGHVFDWATKRFVPPQEPGK